MEGYRVVTMDEACDKADIFVTATGNVNVINHEHMKKNARSGHRLQHRSLRQRNRSPALRQYQWENIKPQVDHHHLPGRQTHHPAAEGRLVNLGCATGHPSFVMSNSFTNQTLAQIELFTRGDSYQNDVYVLAETSGRKVGPAASERIGANLTRLSDEQATYLSMSRTALTSRITTATKNLFHWA